MDEHLDWAEGLRVALFVRNVVVRAGIDSILRQLPAIRATYECDLDKEVKDLITDGGVDVVVVTTAENDLVREVVPPGTGTKVLLLLDELEAADAETMTELYADGVQVQQDLTPSVLANALRRMVGGEMSLPSGLGRRLLSRSTAVTNHGWPRPAALTSRERETLTLLAEGLSNKELARRLAISDHGAKRLVTSVMLKLGVQNRTAAVVVGIRAGMISLEHAAEKNGIS